MLLLPAPLASNCMVKSNLPLVSVTFLYQHQKKNNQKIDPHAMASNDHRPTDRYQPSMNRPREQAGHHRQNRPNSHDQPKHSRPMHPYDGPFRAEHLPVTAPLGPPTSPPYEHTHSNPRSRSSYPPSGTHRPYPEAHRQTAGHSDRRYTHVGAETRSGIPFEYLSRPGGSSFPAQSGTAPLSGASREKDIAEEACEWPGNYSRFQPPTTPPLTSRRNSIPVPTDVPENERELPCNRPQVALTEAINDVESKAETDDQRRRRRQRKRHHRENYRERFVGLYSINGPLCEDVRVPEIVPVIMNFQDEKGAKVARLDITLPVGGIKEGRCLDIVALYKGYTGGDIELFAEWGERVESKRGDGGRTEESWKWDRAPGSRYYERR
jgi:hypothetical protein